MKNQYQTRGDVTAIFVTHKNLVLEALINTNDLSIANSFTGTWFASRAKSNGKYYVYGIPRDENGKQFTLRLHRLLTNCPKGLQVDHINQDTLDNRQSNLRIVTHAQNRQNLGVYSNNKSGYRGVCWHKRDHLWIANISVNGRFKELGRFTNKEEAAKVAKEARLKLYPYSMN